MDLNDATRELSAVQLQQVTFNLLRNYNQTQ
jgi:hypothetical protein